MLARALLSVGAFIGLSGAVLAQSESVPAPAAAPVSASATFAPVYHSGIGSIQPNGFLAGSVAVVGKDGELQVQPNAMVTIVQGGKIITSAKTDAEGQFSLQGLVPGVYDLVSESDTSFAAISFIAHYGAGENGSMSIYATRMKRFDVEEIIDELWVPDTAGVGEPTFGRFVEPSQPAVQSPQVRMQDGVVRGQMVFPAKAFLPSGHMVKAYRDGKLIASAPVDASGAFQLEIGTPGPIDVIVGGGAFSAISVYVADSENLANNATRQKFVATANNLQADTLFIPVAQGDGPPPAQQDAPLVDLPPDGFIGPPQFGGGGGAGGGGGGGVGGGGGGGIGGGGLGGLVGIAGLATGVAALATSDEGFVGNIPTPVAPVVVP